MGNIHLLLSLTVRVGDIVCEPVPLTLAVFEGVSVLLAVCVPVFDGVPVLLCVLVTDGVPVPDVVDVCIVPISKPVAT